VLEVPRSARLAAWGSAFLAGTARLTDLLAAVTAGDEPHAVSAHPELMSSPGLPFAIAAGQAGQAGLAELLEQLRTARCPGLRVVLPVPGDALGLPGPASFNRVAIQAGECVLSLPGPDGTGWGLIPAISEFGSQWEPGTLVSWTVYPVENRPGQLGLAVADADRELREVLTEATELLAGLDLSGWRPSRAADALPGTALAPSSLPPGVTARAVRVLASAARVRAIVALATEHPGVALDDWHEQRRAEALRRLDTVARHAVTAAANAALETLG
jgi:hypothetical protein